MASEIDYIALGNAMSYYKSMGYEQIEVPWAVPLDDIMLTCPMPTYATHAPDLAPNDYLVGSAEQGFLYLDRRGLLVKNKQYVACTPCFRNDAADEWHQPYFMKIELYHAMPSEYMHDADFLVKGILENTLKSMIQIASNFFQRYEPMLNLLITQNVRSVKCVKTDQGYDLEYDGIEFGSYGIRKDIENNLCWIYGTGLAEPRFSKAVSIG